MQMQMQTLTGERRTVTLIKMHNFALLASAVLCCICIKCGSEPLTTSLPNHRAIYLPSTLHLDRCLRTGFYFGGACFLLFITLSGAHRHRQRHRPKMLRVRWLRSAFISRMSDLPPRGGVPAPSPLLQYSQLKSSTQNLHCRLMVWWVKLHSTDEQPRQTSSSQP